MFPETIHLSLVMRKPTFCICENKDADQLRGYRKADQRLCFRYRDSTIPLLSKSEISSLEPSSVAVQPGLCWTWLETRTLVFSWRGSFNFFWPNCAADQGLCVHYIHVDNPIPLPPKSEISSYNFCRLLLLFSQVV